MITDRPIDSVMLHDTKYYLVSSRVKSTPVWHFVSEDASDYESISKGWWLIRVSTIIACKWRLM